MAGPIRFGQILQLKTRYDQQAVLSRVAKGDTQAFSLFFNYHWGQVYGTGLRLTKSVEKAEDLAQEIFLKIWEQRERLADITNPDDYIFIVSRNFILDFLRKRVFDTENIETLIDYFEDPAVNVVQKMEYKELEETLKAAVDGLSGKVKEVFMLSRFDGLTHEQIAQQLGITVNSSKTYIVRALQEIRKYMAAHGDNKTIILSAGIILYGIS